MSFAPLLSGAAGQRVPAERGTVTAARAATTSSPPARDFARPTERQTLERQTIEPVIARIERVESEVVDLQRTVEIEILAVSDRQYLSRCFDLLNMELRALREYVGELPAGE